VKIAIGSDHAGFALKQRLTERLLALGHEVVDLGTDAPEPPVDYPDFCFPVAERVARGEVERGVVLGGSGIGEAIAANKVAGVRASVDSNVLALGGRTNDHESAVRWLDVWLTTPFEGGRHVPRLRKIAEYEAAHSLGG